VEGLRVEEEVEGEEEEDASDDLRTIWRDLGFVVALVTLSLSEDFLWLEDCFCDGGGGGGCGRGAP
jgi:hypothetical protein